MFVTVFDVDHAWVWALRAIMTSTYAPRRPFEMLVAAFQALLLLWASSSGNAAEQGRLQSNSVFIGSSEFHQCRHMLLLETDFKIVVIVSLDADGWSNV
jgi:hypothetical protein